MHLLLLVFSLKDVNIYQIVVPQSIKELKNCPVSHWKLTGPQVLYVSISTLYWLKQSQRESRFKGRAHRPYLFRGNLLKNCDHFLQWPYCVMDTCASVLPSGLLCLQSPSTQISTQASSLSFPMDIPQSAIVLVSNLLA